MNNFIDISNALTFSVFMSIMITLSTLTLLVFFYVNDKENFTQKTVFAEDPGIVSSIVDENKAAIKYKKDIPQFSYKEILYNEFIKGENTYNLNINNDIEEKMLQERAINYERKEQYKEVISEYYEKRNYNVKKDDYNIDLICQRRGKIVLIYCRNYPLNEAIHIKHIKRFYSNVLNYIHSKGLAQKDVKLKIVIPNKDVLTTSALKTLRTKTCKSKLKIIKA